MWNGVYVLVIIFSDCLMREKSTGLDVPVDLSIPRLWV